MGYIVWPIWSVFIQLWQPILPYILVGCKSWKFHFVVSPIHVAEAWYFYFCFVGFVLSGTWHLYFVTFWLCWDSYFVTFVLCRGLYFVTFVLCWDLYFVEFVLCWNRRVLFDSCQNRRDFGGFFPGFSAFIASCRFKIFVTPRWVPNCLGFSGFVASCRFKILVTPWWGLNCFFYIRLKFGFNVI